MNNKIYLYDGSFPELLDLINKLLEQNSRPLGIYNKEDYEPSLLEEAVKLELNNTFDINKLKVSKNILKAIYYVYLSSESNKELIIYYFLLNARKYQDRIFTMRNLKCVTSTLEITKHVSNELHKLKGFLRFKEINNHVLYGEIEPTNNVIGILSNHFAKRLRNEYWIIKDVGRNLYSIYDKKKYYIISGENIEFEKSKISDEEKEVENLWKSFFNTIGIEARKNKRCQMNFMPKKYWKYMLEMRDEIEKSNNG